MKFKLNRVKEKITRIPTENLYIALIGRIKSEIVSNDLYINKGELPYYYTVVKKEDKYTDVLINANYNFRNEDDNYTILKMTKYPVSKDFVSLDTLRDEINEYCDSLENEINKYNLNKPFVRSRSNYKYKKSLT